MTSVALNPDDAAALMRAARLEPLVPYPGSASKWKCRCMRCNEVVYPLHSSIKQGRGGCNFCAKKDAHSSSALDPKVAVQLMIEAGLRPLEPYSTSKSEWRCECLICGEVVVTTHDNVKQGGGCRFCGRKSAGQKRRHSEDDAVALMRAAGLEPMEPYPGTVMKWKCKCSICGKEVTPTHDRVKQGGSGCRFCGRKSAGQKRRHSEDDAVAVMRRAGLEPLGMYPGAGLAWKCKCLTCGRNVSPSYNTVRQGGGCRYCAKLAVDPLEAEELMRAAGVQPLLPYRLANAPWPCRCLTCGRSVSPWYAYVRITGNGCIYCSGRKVDEIEAIAIMRKSGFEPLTPYPGALAKWLSRCIECGKESEPYFGAVKSQGTRCKYCQQNVTDPQEAVALMNAAGLKPLVPYPGAGLPWLCKCDECEREVTPTYGTVRAGGRCIYCAGRKVDEKDAVAVMRNAGFEPLTEYPGSGTPWPCSCLNCGRQSEPYYGAVKGMGTGCIYCGKERAAQAMRLDPEAAAVTMRAAGLRPLEPYVGSAVPWRCQCLKCKREVTPSYASVKSGGGCRYCASSGLDFAAPAIIYLVTSEALNAHKIGIGAASGTRLRLHKRQGWEVFKTAMQSTGEDAFRIEQEILNWLRNDLGISQGVPKGRMPQGGETETVCADDISMPDIWAKVLSVMSEQVLAQN